MAKLFRLRLQFFGGEGASAGASSGAGEGGAQATSGVNASAAAEQRLRELGVPSDKAKRRASTIASRMPQANASIESATAVDSTNAPQEAAKTEEPKALSFDDLLKSNADYNNAYNQRMQAAVTERVKSEKARSQKANDALTAMTPAIEVMARKYGLDAKNMDYEALAKAIENDDAYYEEKAMEMGTSVETAKRVDQMEREKARRDAQDQMNIQQMQQRNYFISLNNQADKLRETFPNFNLKTELQNPAFARMVDPKVGISVEDAYYAVHRKELQAVAMQTATQKTAEMMTNAIASGSKRPAESGTTSQASSVTTFDYRNASKEQREAFKKDLRASWARGEKVYVK